MIRKLLRRVFQKNPLKLDAPAYLSAPKYGINHQSISHFSYQICQTLQENGYQAYIVGGAVRDLLLNQKPKDFDIATNATPEQIRRLFRRARIIGRRFKIVHVINRQELIEVTTFRSLEQDQQTDDHGRVLRDNSFGTQAEDAFRRDFTINALYYDPIKEIIVDYHQGVLDIKNKTLRIIGNPSTRYREDPVRMLRALRLSAKLKLIIDPEASQPIIHMGELIENVPSARLNDEISKLLLSGHALACIHKIQEYHLQPYLFPLIDTLLANPKSANFIEIALHKTDKRITEGKSASPNFIFAALLWPMVQLRWQENRVQNNNEAEALLDAIEHVLDTHSRQLLISNRISAIIKTIWMLQPRFERRLGRYPYRLLSNPYYRIAWDFLLLRADAGHISPALAQWWDEFSHASSDKKEQLLELVQNEDIKTSAPRKRKRRYNKKPEPKNLE